MLAWTALSWGGRVGLLTDAESSDAGSWARIGGSILIGLLAAAAFFTGRAARPMAWIFALWTLGVWSRSLWVVWSEPNTLGFQMVHTVLAAVWFGLAALAVRIHGLQAGSGTRSSERDGVPGGSTSTSRSTTSSTDR